MKNVTVEFQSTTPSSPNFQIQLALLGTTLSARELIRQTVLEQCRQAALRPAVRPQYLSETEIAAMNQSGRIALPVLASVELDSRHELELALAAFEQRRFLLLAGDRQIESLDTEITFHPALAIFFIRLIPLVGG
ncbi:hypothetical protein [Janthinobacterium sp. B9-8]|uniref:hypothetical protein n=1 Tax=Janthinobacterium sp. B9-8 TaxID=1236179 RepID=UPI00061D0680|nr:hypothetical protein [Janthinobacterium sp. B9-8]AMC35030.1 hypothetical protein VN23_10610 [Janthinobacterium sp. B9-8]